VIEKPAGTMYRHPTDYIQWMKFDDEFSEFGKE